MYHKEGGGFCFVYLPLDAAVDILSKKAIDVFFLDGTNAFGEHRSLKFTDSAENIVPPATQIKVYLERNGLYLSQTYFVVHSKCDLLDYILSILMIFRLTIVLILLTIYNSQDILTWHLHHCKLFQ